MNKVIKSLKRINLRLYLALLVLGLCPAIYTTLRTFFLGQLPGEWSYSIAGQLSWVNLIYEIVNEAIILPLFFFIGKVVSDKKEFTNRIKTGLLISLGVYSVLSVLILIFAEPLLSAMAASPDIIGESAAYIRIDIRVFKCERSIYQPAVLHNKIIDIAHSLKAFYRAVYKR